MLATDKQINYLCFLANKVEKIKSIVIKEKVAIKNLPDYIDWTKERHLGVTSIDASIRICAYKKIIRACNTIFVLFGMKQI